MSEYFGYAQNFSVTRVAQLADVVRGGAAPQDGQVLRFNGLTQRWAFVPINDGDVNGPGSSTINAIARFATNEGKEIKNSGVTISDGADVNGVHTLSLSGATSGSLTLQAAAVTTSHALFLPPSQGAAGTYLSNDGSGVLKWVPGDATCGCGTIAVLWSPVYGAPSAVGLVMGGNAIFKNVTSARYVQLVKNHNDVSILYVIAPSTPAHWELRVQMQLYISSSNHTDYVKIFGNATSTALPLVNTGETVHYALVNPNDTLFSWSHNGVDGMTPANTGIEHDRGYCTWILTRFGDKMRFEMSAMYDKPGMVMAWTLPSAVPVVGGTAFGVAASCGNSTNWSAQVSTFELRTLS
jgi:hypothetical protein